MLQDRLDDMGVVVDAELVGHGEEQRVGLGDGLVRLQLLDEHVGLGGIAAAEDGALFGLDEAEMVLAVAAAEIGAVAVVDQREDAAADRDARRRVMAGFLPGGAVGADLLGLLDVEGLAALVELERRALQVHAELGRPFGRGVGGRAPPDALAQPFRMRLEAQQAGRVREHRPRIGLGKALAAQDVEEDLGVAAAPCRRRSGLPAGLIAEIAPAIDDLLGRAAADAELQAPAGDEVGRAGILGHVERVLVAHVDDRRADLDAAGLRADRRQQREGRAELAGEMMHAEIGAVGAQFLGGDGQVDRLQQRVGRRARLRLRRGRPMAEGQEADLLHEDAA